MEKSIEVDKKTNDEVIIKGKELACMWVGSSIIVYSKVDHPTNPFNDRAKVLIP